MDDGEMSLVIERLEGCQRRMQPEEAIEIENLVCGYGDAGAHGVVVLLAVGNDDVEAVCSAALEDDHQAATGIACGFGHDGADEEAGDGRGAGDGQCAFVQEESAVDLHVCLIDLSRFYRRWNSGEPSSNRLTVDLVFQVRRCLRGFHSQRGYRYRFGRHRDSPIPAGPIVVSGRPGCLAHAARYEKGFKALFFGCRIGGGARSGLVSSVFLIELCGRVIRGRRPVDGNAGKLVGSQGSAKFMRLTSAPVLTQVEDSSCSPWEEPMP